MIYHFDSILLQFWFHASNIILSYKLVSSSCIPILNKQHALDDMAFRKCTEDVMTAASNHLWNDDLILSSDLKKINKWNFQHLRFRWVLFSLFDATWKLSASWSYALLFLERMRAHLRKRALWPRLFWNNYSSQWKLCVRRAQPCVNICTFKIWNASLLYN